jgi:V/A-type H+-transporting ATPase subunit B
MHKVYHRIERIAGSVITVQATGVSYREMAQVTSRQGVSLAQVIRIEGGRVDLQVFAGSRGVSTDAQIRFLGHPMQVPFSGALLGRVFDGSGRPRDRGPAVTENLIPIGGPAVNPAKRIIPRHMVRTGIPMIDVFNTLVESQKLPIFSVAGEPYNPLLARIALQAEVDAIVLGGMGLKHDDYLFFRDLLEEHGALSRSVLFIHTAADPTVECLLVPDVCLAVAEQFALEKKRVLVLLTDMTNFADSLKEIAITMEQVPSNRGYPGDLYSQLAARYEKAVDFDTAGSITILAATTMPGDDVTHPVPDNTGYITEGQFYLRGGRIEPFGSLSRLKQLVNGKTREDHRTIMNTMIQLFANYRETLEKQSMGFRLADWDRKLLKYGERFEAEMMDLSVNIPLEEALDLGWEILADCFDPEETGVPTRLIEMFWPGRAAGAGDGGAAAPAAAKA